jgi:hypothetical protein
MRAAVQVSTQFALALAAFIAGMAAGGARDQTEELPPRTVGIPVASGSFEDVEMSVESSMGPTFRWVCDLHLTPDGLPDRAECRYRDP